jgi:chromosomal replication initiation ATPase DnaA
MRHINIDIAQLFPVKRDAANETRNMAIYLLRYIRGDSLTTNGNVFNIRYYSTVSSIIERFKVRMLMERKLTRKVEEAKKILMRQRQT